MAVYFPVDAHLARTLRLPLLAGRFIEDADIGTTRLVAVVDEHPCARSTAARTRSAR